MFKSRGKKRKTILNKLCKSLWWKKEGGFTVTELLVALTLIGLLGGSLLTLIFSGSNIFRRIFNEKNAISEARIAISYITVKLI